MTDPLNRVTELTYDVLSRPYRTYNKAIQASPLLQQTWTADGLRASLSDANGNTTNFAYDGFDRLDTTTYPGGSTETFTYDKNSNVVTRQTRAGGTIGFAYDTLNRLITKTPPSGPVVTYAYDLAGRLTSVSDTSAAIAAAVPPGGTPVAYTTSYSYDALNRPQGASFGPVAAATAPTAAASVLFGHGYNAANQRTGQTVSDNSWIDYPPASPSTTAYTANTMNQYSAVGGVTPSYDSNGNLTFDGTYFLGYDAENRLVSMGTTGSSAAYLYDGRGRRKQKAVNLVPVVSVTDADNREVLEYDGSSGALLRWYAYGLGPNDVLGQMNVPAGTRLALVPDIQGSIVATMDAGTATLGPFAYRPFGSATATPAAFGYTGQRIDPETGLYYYRARHYHPAWGRFAQNDPAGYDQGPNLYAYVLNDPLNVVDPTGQFLNFIVGAAIGFSVDLAAQLVLTGTYDYRQGLLATGSGALTGGVSAAIGRTALGFGSQVVANAAVGAAGNAAQTAALNAWSGQDANIGSAAILGATFGAAGYAASRGLISYSASARQSRFDASDLNTRLMATEFARTNQLNIGGPSAAAVVVGTTTGNAIGNATSFFPDADFTNLSIFPSAHGATISGGK